MWLLILMTQRALKKAEIKKTRLENQGYKLINNRNDLLIYRNENYLNKKSTSLGA